jgi:hypothetical protein
MAELVDAPDSKSGYRKVVQVRFLFRARFHRHSYKPATTAGFFVSARSQPLNFSVSCITKSIELFSKAGGL